MEKHEWDIFERLEKLEPEIEKLGPEVGTATKVSTVSLFLLFSYLGLLRPDRVRNLKDLVVSTLKDVGLSRDDVEVFESLFLKVCDLVEKER